MLGYLVYLRFSFNFYPINPTSWPKGAWPTNLYEGLLRAGPPSLDHQLRLDARQSPLDEILDAATMEVLWIASCLQASHENTLYDLPSFYQKVKNIPAAALEVPYCLERTEVFKQFSASFLRATWRVLNRTVDNCQTPSFGVQVHVY